MSDKQKPIVLSSQCPLGTRHLSPLTASEHRSALTILPWLLIFAVPLCVAAEHRPLLPQPQEVEYRSGRLALRELTIGFASNPSPEDLFSANVLSSALSLIRGKAIPVQGIHPSRPAIILIRTGATDALPGPNDHAGPDSREAYEIRIDSEGAEIRSRSSAGLFYGVQTMRQLVEGDPGDQFLPRVTIRDWPAMAYRGFMMDMSHGPLPTDAEVERQIDFLARWKVNQYYFYSEASIALPGYDLVNPDGRFAEDEINRIVNYARERHIAVVPLAELYGHLHDVFRIEHYSDLSLLPHGGEINPLNPRTQAFLEDWVRQLAKLFPSPWFHMGLDEPWELDRSPSILGGGVDPSKLFIDQLRRTAALLTQLGKRPMFWADVHSGANTFDKHPELFSQLPKEVIAVPWHYEPEPDYSVFVAPFAREHIQQVVQPGIWCWSDIAPDLATTFANIDGFTAAGHQYGALGMINSGWTDSSQILYRTALPGMAYGAVAAWQSKPVDHHQFFLDYASQMYPSDAAVEMAAGLQELSEADHLTAEALGNYTVDRLWEDPFTPARLKHVVANREKLRQERLLAENAQKRFRRALAVTHDSYTLPSLIVAAQMLDYAGMRYIYAAEIDGFFKTLGRNPRLEDVHLYIFRQMCVIDHGRLIDLMDAVATLRGKYRSAWLDQYTDYRLDTEIGRWDAEFEYWRRFQARLLELAENFKRGDTLPSLEELRPHLY
jgi:hexosaminidase